MLFKRILVLGGAVISAAFILSALDVYRVGSHSMAPAVPAGSFVIVNRYHYFIFDPKKGDIAVFRPVNGFFSKGLWTHRIIATPGDIVSLNDGLLYVNGELTQFPMVDSLVSPETLAQSGNVALGSAEIFQKGDNSKQLYGILAKEALIGKIIFVLNP